MLSSIMHNIIRHLTPVPHKSIVLLLRLHINQCALPQSNQFHTSAQLQYNMVTVSQTNGTGAIGNWTQLSSSVQHIDNNSTVPIPRSSHCIGIHNNILYVYGGENEPRTPINNDIYRYDINSKQWLDPISINNSAPTARVGHNSVLLNDKLYVYGGRTAVSHEQNSLQDFWYYNVKTKKWTEIANATGESPSYLSYFAMTSYIDTNNQSYIFIFGGCPLSGRSNKLYRYTVESNQWTLLNDGSSTNAPTPRGGASIAVAHNNVYVMFGYNGKNELNDQYVYNLDTRQWNMLTSNTSVQPEARSVTDLVYLSGIGASGALFVFGGESSPSSRGHLGSGNFLSSAYLYDISANQWKSVNQHNDSTKQSDIPLARGWFTTHGNTGHSVVLFGGLAENDVRLNDVWIWTAQ